IVARIQALVDGEHADVADDRLGSAQRRAAVLAASGDLLGQHKVDAVAGENEAGDAGGGGHTDGDSAHARAERGGEEAALAGANDGALAQRLAGGDLVADDGAGQALWVCARAAAE